MEQKVFKDKIPVHKHRTADGNINITDDRIFNETATANKKETTANKS